ncbi:MAG: flagellin [Deltaproteobacteria bacterium]|nr:flagellin [Deltaproteobacteria bacterium]
MVPTGEGTLVPLNLTGREVFFHNDALPESVDIFSLLFAVKRGLETNDPEVLRNRLDDLDHAHEQLLLKRAEVGGTRKEMDAHLEKLTDQEGTKTQQMSDLEDLDFAEAAVEMNLADIRHKASLDTGSRLVQPSLLNFLK